MVGVRVNSLRPCMSPALKSRAAVQSGIFCRYIVAGPRGSAAIRGGDRAPGTCENTVSGGQATKGIRWMPWHQEAMKDVAKLRKATGSRKQASIRGSPNRETGMDEVHAIAG